MIKFSKESGAIKKKEMAVLGIIAAVCAVSVFLIISFTKPKPQPVVIEKEPEPVYEVRLDDKVRFKLQEVKDRGDILKAEESRNPNFVRQDVTTTERFIEVTIAVDNISEDNLSAGSWDVREVYGKVDEKEGRKYYSSTLLNYWTSSKGECGGLLKPGFSPTLCTKIYDVAKTATNLKIEVYLKENKMTAFIDLGL